VHVADDGPAARAGFFQGDILVGVDGQALTNADDLQALLGPNRVGSSVPASVVRAGALVELQVTIGAREP
jgi:S1-C subfamily serine protease